MANNPFVNAQIPIDRISKFVQGDKSAPLAVIDVFVDGNLVSGNEIGGQLAEVKVKEEVGRIKTIEMVINGQEGSLGLSVFEYGKLVQVVAASSREDTNLFSANFVVRGIEAAPTDGEFRVYGLGTEIEMASTEVRRSFGPNVSDSDIAAQIADKHGFSKRKLISQTKNIYESVLQVNQTDYEFLCDRAEINGFDFYIEDGVFHFHPEAYGTRSANLTASDIAPPQNRIISAMFEVVRNVTPLDATITGIDKSTKETFTHTSSRDINIKNTILKGGTKNAYNLTKPISTDRNTLRQKFVYSMGQNMTRTEQADIADRLASDSQWVVRMTAEINPYVKLRPRDRVFVSDTGIWAGEYNVMSVKHSMLPGYKMFIEAERKYHNATLANSKSSRSQVNIREARSD